MDETSTDPDDADTRGADATDTARIAGKKELGRQLGADALIEEAEREEAVAQDPNAPGVNAWQRNADDRPAPPG